ncbi:hypothetical protein EFR00_00390 [Rhizobium sophoriradicis]|uniref:hypothetical protein n=1 Tax=Rhizobium sophoriradicis TaxID=1535245 RepID=UPI00098F4993|nr:hypothetical protein [Rhizobium sophoriradicis]RSC20989.1 hypothetical protein EFR00_00390 [Rhizobium sophoriradicis]
MPDPVEPIELKDLDDSELSDDESSADQAAEDLDAILDQIIGELTAGQQQQLQQAEAASPSITQAASAIANRTAVAALSRSVPSMADVPDATFRQMTKEQIEDLRSGLDSLQDAVNSIAKSPGKGPLYTRQKFWAFVIPSVLVAASSITAIIALAISNQSKNPESDSTDTDEIPEELKQILTERAEEWKNLPLAELCNRMRDFALAYAQSMLAQLVAVRDLKLLVIDAAKRDELDAFAQKTAPGIAVAVENAYVETEERPRFKTIYDTIKRWKLQQSDATEVPLTVPQAVIVLELAIARIYSVIKAAGKHHD